MTDCRCNNDGCENFAFVDGDDLVAINPKRRDPVTNQEQEIRVTVSPTMAQALAEILNDRGRE